MIGYWIPDHVLIFVRICNTLRNKRKLRNKEVQLRVGNGARVAAVTVGRIELYLPNGLVTRQWK